MTMIQYSEEIEGAGYTYFWKVRFDLSNGDCLGISQFANGKLERVLLSREQIVALIKFVKGKLREDFPPHPRRE